MARIAPVTFDPDDVVQVDPYTLLLNESEVSHEARFLYVRETLRGCLVSQSAGEHEGFSAQRRTTFAVRSPATGRKSGRRWAEKTRAQPGMTYQTVS